MTTLHLMVGLPYSGKTTLAKKLEVELPALRLTPDDWHRILFGQDAVHPEHDERQEKIEALLWEIAASTLKNGLDVMLDFGLWSKVERRNFKQRATELGAETKIHFIDVSFAELLERLDLRNQLEPDEATFIPLPMMHEYFPKFQAPDAAEMALNSN